MLPETFWLEPRSSGQTDSQLKRWSQLKDEKSMAAKKQNWVKSLSEKPFEYAKLEGDVLTLKVKLNVDTPRESSTGKSYILYTSHGFQFINGVGINLTVIQPKRQR